MRSTKWVLFTYFFFEVIVLRPPYFLTENNEFRKLQQASGMLLQLVHYEFSIPFFCNILYLTNIFFKIGVMYAHRVDFFDLVLFTFKNFWHLDYVPAEKLILNDCKRAAALVSSSLLLWCLPISFIFNMPLYINIMSFSHILANIGKNESERILPFNMWLDFPIEKSPIFEALFTIQTMSLQYVGICYICFDNFLCLANFHVVSQFRILQYRLASIHEYYYREINKKHKRESDCANICYTRLRGCVEYHQMLTEYCSKLEKIFSQLILGQVLFLSLVICLLSCQMFLVSIHYSFNCPFNYSSNIFYVFKIVEYLIENIIFRSYFQAPFPKRVGLMLNITGSLCQAFLFTYSCDGLNRHNAHVGESVLSGPWSNLSMDKVGRRLRKNVIMIIMRSNHSCSLTAGGFFPVSLETYTGILSTAMSYFTLLRQSSLNNES
ncbi:odorant receptor 10-like [Calliopsis andreniformis]|uniref:odorant receptor 10-like n=1 Tax=Calliopsis andreniformis TaxID=337506 RepID=UPI003FCC88BE